MNRDKHHIDQLTSTMMQQYLEGKLSDDMRYKVERYLLDHPFEAEAMEGFESIEMTHLDSDIEQMKKDLFAEEKETEVIPIWQRYWKVAAVITVLIVSTFLILNLGQEEINSSKTELALNEESSISEEVEESGKSNKKEVVEEAVESGEEKKKENSDDISTSYESEVNDIPKEKTRVELLSLVDEESETEEIVEELIEADRTVVEEYHELAEIAKEEVITEQSRISSNGAVSREKSVTPITISNVSKVVSGKITTTEGGPLPGVNVVVKGTTHGTISDVDGNYEITVPEGQPSLAYSFIGYGTEEVQVGNRQVVDAELSQDMSQLSEVVVTAQGIERETKSLGYAISKKKDVRKQGAMPVIGFEAYTKYLQDSLRYPQEAIDKQVHGVVLVGFTVGKSGQLSKLEVKEGLGYGCDEEAIRLIKEGTGWQSAKNRRGDNVNELVKVEVTFEN